MTAVVVAAPVVPQSSNRPALAAMAMRVSKTKTDAVLHVHKEHSAAASTPAPTAMKMVRQLIAASARKVAALLMQAMVVVMAATVNSVLARHKALRARKSSAQPDTAALRVPPAVSHAAAAMTTSHHALMPTWVRSWAMPVVTVKTVAATAASLTRCAPALTPWPSAAHAALAVVAAVTVVASAAATVVVVAVSAAATVVVAAVAAPHAVVLAVNPLKH